MFKFKYDLSSSFPLDRHMMSSVIAYMCSSVDVHVSISTNQYDINKVNLQGKVQIHTASGCDGLHCRALNQTDGHAHIW